jgi:hypothetical protein
MRRVRAFSRKTERTPHPRRTQNIEISNFPQGWTATPVDGVKPIFY